MRTSSSGHAGQAIERMLELSADAQITRRKTAKDSPAFHNLTEAIAAYGKALDLLSKFPHVQEEPYTIISQWDLPDCIAAVTSPNLCDNRPTVPPVGRPPFGV